MRDYGLAKGYDLGPNPTNSVLALFPGGLIIVPALITYWRGTRRVQGATRLGNHEPVNGWIALILYLLLAPGLWAYLQSSLNTVWRSEAEALAGHPAPPAPSDRCPHPSPRTQHRRLSSARIAATEERERLADHAVVPANHTPRKPSRPHPSAPGRRPPSR